MDQITVTAPWGAIRGWKGKTCYQFLGIPYGKAKRFQKPEPVAWKGVRDCLTYGPRALQPGWLGKKPQGTSFFTIGSEDCLNLNVWTSKLGADAKLPVAVYVHGGAFQVGGNSVPARSGDLFIEEEPMVFVSVNYRLGVLGFLQLGEEYGDAYANSGNQGIWDLLLAFRWIQENIQAFGGDPERITYMGISAGAKAIASLLTTRYMNSAHQVVLESGGLQAFRSRKTAAFVSRAFQQYVPSRASLLALSGEELMRSQAAFCGREGATCFFGPVWDSELFSRGSGLAWTGRAIIGSSLRELEPLAQTPAFLENPAPVVADLFGENQEVAWEQYRKLRQAGEERSACWSRILSDFMYRFYSDDLARRLEKDGNPVWCYSFAYPPASHGTGFYFLMNQWREKIPAQADPEEARRVAQFMRSCIRRFICTGTPQEGQAQGGGSWRTYDGAYKMIFDRIPHVEKREADTLAGYPETVFVQEGQERGN